jgi:hypothetical protein
MIKDCTEYAFRVNQVDLTDCSGLEGTGLCSRLIQYKTIGKLALGREPIYGIH